MNIHEYQAKGLFQKYNIPTNEFVSKIYAEFGPLAKGRKIIPRENGVSFQIREEIEPYNPLFDGKKYDIGNKNTHS